MSLLFVSDIHIWHTTPRSRIDDYRASSLAMLKKVGEAASHYKVEAILLGGDLGHDTDWPISLYHEVRDVLRTWPVPTYIALGNHDMDNYNLETYKRKGVGALEDAGVLCVQDLIEIGHLWRIEFFHAGTTKAKDLTNGSLVVDRAKDGRIEVAVAHVPIGPIKTPSIKPLSEIFVPFYDFLCLADIHMKFKPLELITGCTVLNPGPLERRSIAEKDEGGFVALIHDNKVVEYVDLGAPPAEEVFMQKVDNEFSEILGQSFLDTVQEIQSQPQQSIIEQIKNMAEALQIEDEPLRLLLEEMSLGG